jgi:hypothetical protein
MDIGHSGQSLIFLISQPRAGSTLTQLILGTHPDIHTVSEPWLMLHPIYALRSSGYQSDYDANLALGALTDFLRSLPDGEEAYFEGLRRMYGYLYNCALSISGKRFFLDKTPRYYSVIPELHHTFPKARFIILLRNPLAVLSSIIDMTRKTDSGTLKDYSHDLLDAPGLLLSGINHLGDRCHVLRYETLVTNPKVTVKDMCTYLGVDFRFDMLQYDCPKPGDWLNGDPLGIYQSKTPVQKSVDKWIGELKDGQFWQLANDYLELLGQDVLTSLGYSYKELHQILAEHRPDSDQLLIPLVQMLNSVESVHSTVETPKADTSEYLTTRFKCLMLRIVRKVKSFVL